MKITWSGIEWDKVPDTDHYCYYFSWSPAWLAKGYRHLGVKRFWYDGPHVQFGFWWVCIGWSAWRTNPPLEFMTDEAEARWLAKPKWVRKIWGLEE